MTNEKNYTIRKVWNYNRFDRNFVVGELVKLIFIGSKDIGGEGMWVKITEAKGYKPRSPYANEKGFHEETFNTEFKGTLENIPIYFPNLKCWQDIEFSLEHIVKRSQ